MSVPGTHRFRNVLVAGLPGVGKSTFARAYAQMSRTDFVELDRYVERLAGKSIAEIFAQDGEAAFRELEMQCLERLMKRQRCTIALGGGTLTHLPSLKMAQELGCIVLLTASIEVIAQRVWPQKDSRPLLSPCQTLEELTETLKKLWQIREESYRSADLILETTHSSVDTLKIELSWLEQNLLASPGVALNLDTSSFLSRALPLADVDYRSPREQRSSREITDKTERFLKAQRQKERGDKRDKRERKNQQGRRNNEGVAASRASGSTSKAASATLREGGPQPRESAPQPRGGGPQLREDGPQPRESAPQPRESAPQPREGGPRPRESAPQPREGGPQPRASGPQPREGGPSQRAARAPKMRTGSPRPRDVGPTPRESNSSPRNEPKAD